MYADGFVLPIKKDRVDDYREMATKAGELWIEHGALSYVECIGDDVPDGKVTSFPISVKLEDNEVVCFAWATYNSREHRDEVMAKVMADERMTMDDENPPMDPARMFWGGFETIVQL